MDYRYTDTDDATVTLTFKLCDIESLRGIFEAINNGDVSGISKWRVRQLVRAMAGAQAKAAEVLARDAQALAEKAKLPEHF